MADRLDSHAELIDLIVRYFVNEHKPYYVKNLLKPIITRMVLAMSESSAAIELACYRTEHYLRDSGRSVPASTDRPHGGGNE